MTSEEFEPGKLFVGGLSWATKTEGLKAYFSKFGEISDANVMVDKVTNNPRGFGFVTFKNPEDAETVLHSQGPHTIDQKRVDPKKATKNYQTPPKVKVFVGGIPQDAKEEDLRLAFEIFGPIKEVDIKCRGFGFVTFETEDSASKACIEHWVKVNGKDVEIKIAENTRNKSQHGQRAYVPSYYQPQYTASTAAMQQPYPYASNSWDYTHQWSGEHYGGSASNGGYGVYGQTGGQTGSYSSGTGYGATYGSSRDSTGGYQTTQGYNYSQQQQQGYGFHAAGYGGARSHQMPQQPSYNGGFPVRQ